MKYIGQRIPSVTNRALVAGRGTYTADVSLPHMAHVAVVRSTLASARIRSVDASAAEAVPGVLAVVTGAEIVRETRPLADSLDPAAAGARSVETWALAHDRVRYVGEAVAAVVAEDRITAHQAARLVEVDYEELPAVVDAEQALAPDAPRVAPEWPDNRLAQAHFERGDVETALREAEIVLEGVVSQHRYTAAPLEPRAYVADYDRFRDQLVFWASTQNPHPLRVFLARILDMPEVRIRVIQPHVGGAFGIKIPTFQEEPLVAYLARKLGRPVKYVSERREDLLAGGHAREERIHYRVGCSRDGRITALDTRVVADVGAPAALTGWAMAYLTATCIPTVYKVPHCRTRLDAVVTHKCPWNAYRGFGKEAASFFMDRIVEKVARATGVDRVEVRLRNFIQPEEFPYEQVSGVVLDSGDYPRALRTLLERIDVPAFREMQAAARREGRRLGLGFGQELTPEGCALPRSILLGGWDGATVRVNPSGQVTVLTGVTSPGTGNETGIAQIAADALGVPIEDVKVVQGDTDLCPYGLGNYSSRSILLGGSAVHLAATEIREKMRRVAARKLEIAPDDVEVVDGVFLAVGAPSLSIGFREVVALVYTDCHGVAVCEVEPGLESTRYYRSQNIYHQPEREGRFNAYPSWPNQAVACIVEVDPETGVFRVLRYVGVHDSGVVVNPLAAEAQIHGGVAQGIGGAAYEALVYDEYGQLLTTSFMDYTLPTAVEIPPIEVEHQETRSPFSPLGTKGVGESGITGPLGALCSAIEDAFPELDLDLSALPLTPMRVWRAIREARPRAAASGAAG